VLGAAGEAERAWGRCRFLTCSVLPVRYACNCRCRFCFSKSSLSALPGERADFARLDLGAYFRFARERGATRLVITGGGEPLLRPEAAVYLAEEGRRFFDEIACFTNGAYLTAALAARLRGAGLSYLCYSRHHEDDARCRELMGDGAPALDDFFRAAEGLKVRATCVMARGFVDDREAVGRYIAALRRYGVSEFTFKHTYVAYERSVFRGAEEDRWAAAHQIERDPFGGEGELVARLPWGPEIRRVLGAQVCYYYEPTPAWELENGLCRSVNLLSGGEVYASLEDERSLLYTLPPPGGAAA
jgi:MoaA/NifB/PqqE/SkfB family radical SAM enzyme